MNEKKDKGLMGNLEVQDLRDLLKTNIAEAERLKQEREKILNQCYSWACQIELTARDFRHDLELAMRSQKPKCIPESIL